MRALLVLPFLIFLPGAAWAQSAGMTEPALVERLNVRLAADGQDLVKSCRRGRADQFACTFADTRFRTTLLPDTETTGSIDGSIAPTSMTLVIAGGRIDTIELKGDRARPADMINFTAHLESLLHVLGPRQSDYMIEEDTLNLGLLRGDKDPTIGQEKDVSESFATIRCLNQASDVSLNIGCILKVAAAD